MRAALRGGFFCPSRARKRKNTVFIRHVATLVLTTWKQKEKSVANGKNLFATHSPRRHIFILHEIHMVKKCVATTRPMWRMKNPQFATHFINNNIALTPVWRMWRMWRMWRHVFASIYACRGAILARAWQVSYCGGQIPGWMQSMKYKSDAFAAIP